MSKVIIAENSLDSETWKEYETDNILDFLLEYFKTWPDNARIYNKNVDELSDVTPSNVTDIGKLAKMEGPFYVIVYPGEPGTIALVISLVVLAVSIFAMPKVPSPTIKLPNQQQSTNNSLSDRSNKERINGRIPDIFGQVTSIPDLISAPYLFFENNIEYEHSYMCIGRGSYLVENIKEDTTLIDQVDQSSVEVYGPNTSPNSGTAELTIGSPIGIPIKTVTKYTSVNGQILGPESTASISINSKFTSTSKIVTDNLSADFRTLFSVGGTIKVTNAIIWSYLEDIDKYVEFLNLNGTYTISAISRYEVTVSNASSNSDWASLIAVPSDSEFLNPDFYSESAAWIGPFFVNKTDTEEIWCNFVAPNGIYKDDGTTKTPLPVDVSLRLTPVDVSGVPTGSAELFTAKLLWDSTFNLSLGVTLKANPTFTGRMKVEARRITASTTGVGFQVSEEVKWRDFYSVSPITKTDFGDVTTVQSLIRSTEGALAISSRKLNMLVTRKIPTRISGSTFSSTLYPIKKADDIISFICLDSKIGNRLLSEIDFDSIYSEISKIETYFGTTEASEFCYTFDASNLSFEEIISSIAGSIFCTAYRRGSKIKLQFEQENDLSTILFNHRNKIPGTETRTVSFGNVNDNDGVEYQYVNPLDDSIDYIYIPSDKSAVNPNKCESIGVRNYKQAYLNAYRLYNKIKYQMVNIECEVTAEANICVRGDRILISDGTRLGSLEGEIEAQNVLELTLSQNVDLQDGVDYTIFLQYPDGTVDSIPIIAGVESNKVILSRAPSISLALDYRNFARTTFIITSNLDNRKTAFILTEKTPKGVMTSDIKAINYDARYYQTDKDFV